MRLVRVCIIIIVSVLGKPVHRKTLPESRKECINTGWKIKKEKEAFKAVILKLFTPFKCRKLQAPMEKLETLDCGPVKNRAKWPRLPGRVWQARRALPPVHLACLLSWLALLSLKLDILIKSIQPYKVTWSHTKLWHQIHSRSTIQFYWAEFNHGDMFISSCTISYLHPLQWGLRTPISPHSHLWAFIFFLLVGMEWPHSIVLIGISLVISNTEPFARFNWIIIHIHGLQLGHFHSSVARTWASFTGLLAICVLSLERCIIKPVVHKTQRLHDLGFGGDGSIHEVLATQA
jgi:hypothetical protein